MHRLEQWLLTVLVLVLVTLAGAQIFLRNLFGGGISWADPLLRMLVVWTAMLGALAAVRDDKHIAVDVLQRFLPSRAHRAVRILTLLFAAVVCAAMAWYSVGLVSLDFGESSSAAASDALAAIPNWVQESILPTCFALMALRFFLRAFALPVHAPELLHEPRAAARPDGRP
ncbi:MAG: TRAP transporter small permease [Rudaea sp.]